MGHRVVGREDELAAISQVLETVLTAPAALRISGEPGIGKSTLLRAAASAAEARGWKVLWCRSSGAEVRMSYAGLTDLFHDVTAGVAGLPEPQRDALGAALLLAGSGRRSPEPRAVAAATLSLLDGLGAERRVIVAVDDIQWLDEPSRRALTFAVRRCHGPIAIIWTVRAGLDDDPSLALAPPDPARTTTLEVSGLAAPVLQIMVRQRLGRVFPPSVMERLTFLSRGNPLFALEMARTTDPTAGGRMTIPSHLTQSMRARLVTLPPDSREALLVSSAVAVPTADLLCRAGFDRPEDALAPAEAADIVSWTTRGLEFSHPLWQEVIYAASSHQERRAVHRRLSAILEDVEESARHRALAAVGPDPETVTMLVGAAARARSRGAPSTAAELLGLALGLGVDVPEVRLRAAHDYFSAEDRARALDLARGLVAELGEGPQRADALGLIGEMTYQVEDFPQAIPVLEQAYREAVGVPALRATIAFDLAFALTNVGRNSEGQDWADRALACAQESVDPAAIAEARGAVAVLALINGQRIDADRLAEVLADEDVDRSTSVIRWPSTSVALVHLWSHDLEQARPLLERVRRRCLERGLDSGLWLILGRATEAALWSGDVRAARGLAAEFAQKAALADSPYYETYGLVGQVYLASWCGELERARHAYHQLVETSQGAAHALPVMVAMSALGMAELSAGDMAAATACLEPVAMMAMAMDVGDPIVSPFFPDAVETFLATRRPDGARALVDLLERRGKQSGRRWATGVALRGRAALRAYDGELDDAEHGLAQALEVLDTAALRYERARTLLALGRLQRRRRERARAGESLREARLLFEALGAGGWAANARDELDHLGVRRESEGEPSPAELRVARLAATGLTNAAVAARLSISAKTVEANLARVYRKLGIHSRAELGRWFATTGTDPAARRDPG